MSRHTRGQLCLFTPALRWGPRDAIHPEDSFRLVLLAAASWSYEPDLQPLPAAATMPSWLRVQSWGLCADMRTEA